tara:strand:- start:1013 stop:2470 length:1458 start_codon:yes stop_codon:yes gene_type:complete
MVRRLIDGNPRREQRRQVVLLDRLEIGFQRRIKSELARAMRDMVLVYEHTGEVPPARDHVERLTAIYQAMAIATMTVFGGRVVQQGKSSGQVFETKDFASTMARIALGYIAGELLRRRITSVAETTRQQIVNAVDRGYQDGLGQFGVAKLVREAVPSMSTFRSSLIARTETHGAANYGAFAAADETGLLLDKEWISAEDERTREDHALANGQIVGKDEPFDVGGEAMMYPGDPAGSAANVVNCRCALGWVVRDEPDLSASENILTPLPQESWVADTEQFRLTDEGLSGAERIARVVTKDEVVDALAGGLISDPKDANLSFKANSMFFTAKGGGIAEISRRIDLVDMVAHHSILQLDKSAQGSGAGKEILKKSIELYKKIGVQKVVLSANIDVGGYAWAKYGFAPSAENVGSVIDKFRRAANADNSITDKQLSAILKVMEPRNVDSFFALADSKLGKKIMMGSSWEGELNMSDKSSMKRFNNYVGK